jgi:hypothetical protein
MKIYTRAGIVAIAFAVLPNLSRLIPLTNNLLTVNCL